MSVDTQGLDLLDDVADVDWSVRVTNLERRVANLGAALQQAEERAEEAARGQAAVEDEFQRFKEQVVEVGERYAAENEWCGTYESIMSELGLPGRPSSHEVRVRVHYTQYLMVTARSQGEAEELVVNAARPTTWNPGNPTMESVDTSYYAHDIEVELAD